MFGSRLLHVGGTRSIYLSHTAHRWAVRHATPSSHCRYCHCCCCYCCCYCRPRARLGTTMMKANWPEARRCRDSTQVRTVSSHTVACHGVVLGWYLAWRGSWYVVVAHAPLHGWFGTSVAQGHPFFGRVWVFFGGGFPDRREHRDR